VYGGIFFIFVLPLWSSGDIQGSLLRCLSVTKLVRSTPHSSSVAFLSKLYRNDQCQVLLCISSAFSGSMSYGPLIIYIFKVCLNYS
jgi:hypothetical protein